MDKLNHINVDGPASMPESNTLPSAQLLLHRAFRIMRGCGVSASQLAAMSQRALDELQTLPEVSRGNITARQALTCCDVILKWRRDCHFLNSEGQPQSLVVDGHSPSFSELVELAARGSKPSELLEIMVQLGVVRIVDSSTVELISTSVVACPGKEASTIASESVLEHICGFLGSVEYNVFDKPSRAKGKFERACYAWVPRKYVPVLEQLVNNRGQDFVDVIDEWLSRRSAAVPATDDLVLVGAGAYVFVRERLGS
ncbi:MAG TPA: DUF6502 family protein [Steroidobacteraceae bacterium]|nr:DUF6502 family protein [Steroidobacteraceae bacterium]